MELNCVLNSLDDAVKTETLGAIVMLTLFEDIITSEIGCSAHISPGSSIC